MMLSFSGSEDGELLYYDKYGKETHAGNQTRSFTAEEIKGIKTLTPWIEDDVITVGRTRIVEDMY